MVLNRTQQAADSSRYAAGTTMKIPPALTEIL
jgi:hypothetical protein